MASHRRPEVEKRLSRIEGHVRSIQRMLQEGRTYPEIVQQISAVRAALDSVLQVIVDDLVEDCAKRVEKNAIANRTLQELKEVVARTR
jgi:DNA-binding FrmR family transcriptional regulator